MVGILAAKGQGGLGDQADTVVVPLHTLQRRVTGNHRVGILSVSMEDGSDSTRLKASLRQLLRERRKSARTRSACAWPSARSRAKCCCSS